MRTFSCGELAPFYARSPLISRAELRQEDFFSCRLEENADVHADFYTIERGSDDVADHVGAFGQLDDCDDLGGPRRSSRVTRRGRLRSCRWYVGPAPEPLCEPLPRLMPALGEKARTLTGDRPGVSNERARRLLQWQPRYSWRGGESGSLVQPGVVEPAQYARISSCCQRRKRQFQEKISKLDGAGSTPVTRSNYIAPNSTGAGRTVTPGECPGSHLA